MAAARPHPWLRRNVVAVGLVSLLTDASSEMVLPLLPAFVVVLGGGPLWLAWIEGLADAVSSVLKLVAGRWSDRTGRRRPFMLAGYGLSTLVRPLVAFAAVPWHVVMVRVVDRVGKGLRSSPRDALLAETVPPEHRGAAFGFHRAMDHTGAVIGPLVAVAVLVLWTTDLRVLFLLAAVPGVLAVAAIVLGVREVDASRAAARIDMPTKLDAAERRALLRVLVPIGLFGLGRASDAFLLLYAGENRASLVALPLLWVGLHAVKAAFSTFGGGLADRIGPRRAIAIGWTLHVLVYLALAATDDRHVIAVLLVTYGLHHAMSEGPEKALVARLVDERSRATAFGWYHLVAGFTSLGGSLVVATVWESTRPALGFATGAAIAGSATILLALTRGFGPAKP